MKITSTTTFAALVALTAHPAAFAQDAAELFLPQHANSFILPREEITEEFSKEEIVSEEEVFTEEEFVSEEEVFTEEEIVSEEEVISEEPTDGEVVESTVEEEEFVSEEEVFTEEEIVSEEEVISEEPTDGEVVEITVEEEESNLEDGGEVTVGGWPEGGDPIEWVKRGGGELDNPDVIFYSMAGGPALQNMAGGPSPAANESTGGTAARVLNQGETAADIEGTVSGGTGVAKAEKKSTVAIVKQGRVFLR